MRHEPFEGHEPLPGAGRRRRQGGNGDREKHESGGGPNRHENLQRPQAAILGPFRSSPVRRRPHENLWRPPAAISGDYSRPGSGCPRRSAAAQDRPRAAAVRRRHRGGSLGLRTGGIGVSRGAGRSARRWRPSNRGRAVTRSQRGMPLRGMQRGLPPGTAMMGGRTDSRRRPRSPPGQSEGESMSMRHGAPGTAAAAGTPAVSLIWTGEPAGCSPTGRNASCWASRRSSRAWDACLLRWAVCSYCCAGDRAPFPCC